MSDRFPPIGLATVRITLGVITLMHGLYDVFGAFDGPGLTGFVRHVEEYTSTAPALTAYCIGFGSLLAGAGLILGCLARTWAFVALTLAVGTIWFAASSAFFVQNHGCEYLLALSAMAICVLSNGPGALAMKFQRQKG